MEVAGEFVLIVMRLWPFYLLAGAAGLVIAVVSGEGLAQAGRVAVAVTAASVALMPMGWVRGEETRHGFKRLALLFGFSVAWIGLLFAPVVAVLGWADL